ncbi:hypothetical protein TKK_0001765 [Trichogramma kaykai]|uniref:Uncharacterized protein n=1 Tax=Trichogramma kaykai TaxID=54128 RepID=A0ABD2XG55_9HYME
MTLDKDVFETISCGIRKNSLKLVQRVLRKFGPLSPTKLRNSGAQTTDYLLLVNSIIMGRKKITKELLKYNFSVNGPICDSLVDTPLHYAVRFNDYGLVTDLLEKGARINCKNKYGDSSLVLAMKLKFYPIVKLLLLKYFDQYDMLSFTDSNHLVAYYIACLTNDEVAVGHFEARGIAVKFPKSERNWMQRKLKLHYAVRHSHIALLDLLIRFGYSPNQKNYNGSTALHWCFSNFMENRCQKYTCQQMIDVILMSDSIALQNSTDRKGISHFHIACTRDNPKVVRKFIENGVDINLAIPDWSDILPCYTPLHLAADFHCPEVIEELLKHGADANIRDDEGYTPIHVSFNIYASEDVHHYSSGVMINMMFQNSKQENCETPDQLSHFHIACSINNSETVEKFIELGVDINKPISWTSPLLPGYTPLHCAVEFNSVDVIEILLKHKADINVIDRWNKTPLHLAWVKKEKFWYRDMSDKIIDLLLEAHNDTSVNSTCPDGLSHFHIACTRNNLNVVKSFIKRGVKINQRTSSTSKDLKKCTPLHCAVKYNRLDIVKVLLENGADVDLNGKETGYTPLYAACDISYNKTYEIVVEEINSFESNEEPSWQFPNNVLVGQSKFIDAWSENRKNHIEIVKLLLQYNSNVNVQVSGVPLLLHIFKSNKHEKVSKVIQHYTKQYICNHIIELIDQENIFRRKEIMKIFLEYDVDLKAVNPDGYTILHVLAASFLKSESDYEMVESLLRKGVDVNIKTKSNGFYNGVPRNSCYAKTSALHLAVINGHHHYKMIKLLLKHGANVNSRESFLNFTPLHIACQKYNDDPIEYSKIINILMENDAEIEAGDRFGLTPLFAACQANGKSVMEILKHGACINASGAIYETVLHFLVEVQGSNTATGCEIFSVLQTHIKKLKLAELFVREDLQSYCTQLQDKEFSANNNEKLPMLLNQCKKELKILKNYKLNSYCTLYNFIHMGSNELVNYVKNRNVVRLVRCSRFEIDFPHYGYLIKLQFNRGKKRRALIEPAKVALISLTGKTLPDQCSEYILRFFRNEDLKDLIAVTNS